MLFKVGDKVYSGEDIPCAFIMANDSERLKLIEILKAMAPKSKEPRWYISTPKDWTETQTDEWSRLSPAEWSKMTTIAHKDWKGLKYEL